MQERQDATLQTGRLRVQKELTPRFGSNRYRCTEWYDLKRRFGMLTTPKNCDYFVSDRGYVLDILRPAQGCSGGLIFQRIRVGTHDR